jgi:hypothetical protein
MPLASCGNKNILLISVISLRLAENAVLAIVLLLKVGHDVLESQPFL